MLMENIKFILTSIKYYFIRPRNSFYNILFECHTMARLTGLILFTFPDFFESDEITFSRIDILYVILFSIICASVLFTLFIVFFTAFQSARSTVLYVGNMTTIFISTIFIINSILINIYKRQELWKIFQNLDQVDKMLNKFGYKINFLRQYILHMTYGVAIGVCMSLLTLISDMLFRSIGHYGYCLAFIQFVSRGNMIVVMSYFKVILYFTHCRLTDINKCMSQYFHLNIRDNFLNVTTMDHKYAIPIFAMMYEKITETVKLINATHGAKVGVNFGYVFGFTVFTCLSTFRLFKNYNYIECVYFSGTILYNLLCGVLFINCIREAHNIRQQVIYSEC